MTVASGPSNSNDSTVAVTVTLTSGTYMRRRFTFRLAVRYSTAAMLSIVGLTSRSTPRRTCAACPTVPCCTGPLLYIANGLNSFDEAIRGNWS